MGVSYATIEDLYGHGGVVRGALRLPARLIASADPTGDLLELEGHALPASAAVTFTVDPGGVLPAPLATKTFYYARLVELDAGVASEALFQVSATAGGAAIDLTTAGTPPFRIHVSAVPIAQAAIEMRSRWVDGFAIGHIVPFVAPYPIEVVTITARAAGIDVRRALKSLTDEQADMMLASVAKDAERIMRGVPMRDAAATSSANLAVGASPANLSSGVIP